MFHFSYLYFSATVSSMPTNHDLQDIAAIATQACPAAERNESELLNVFHDEMMEAINAINITLSLNSQWVRYILSLSNHHCMVYFSLLKRIIDNKYS